MEKLVISNKSGMNHLTIHPPDHEQEIEFKIGGEWSIWIPKKEIPEIIKHLQQCLKQESHDDKR